MSAELLDFAKSFVEGVTSADNFADPYQAKWKAEGENGKLEKDSFIVSEKLSTIFCLADQYNPDDDRDRDEFDAAELKARVKAILES
jgi:hypothetical protein